MIRVRLSEEIDVDLAHAGLTFKGRVDDPVAVGRLNVIPREVSPAIQPSSIPIHIQP